ncbi:Crp/Fnr family transcriptional regulator [Almyronema epifaneia]|uniref:Crp/Fnr family transcriptional regulator n=1 Tax=Almyronema epifaneia S1 TaxID=2991925 RepID=A0ABW6IKF9_9CYAN
MPITQTQPRPDFVEVLEQLYQERSLTAYTAGQSIPLRAHEIILVCRGVVQLFTIQPDGSETLLGLAGASSPLGLPLTTVDPYWADALTDVDILPLSMAEVESSPVLMAGLFRQMTRRLQQSEAWLALSGKRLVGDRLRHLLMLIADEFGQVDERGIRINIRLTHHQIATAIGTTRVTVTRLLKDFKAEGWLTTHQRFLILSPPTAGFTSFSRLVS